MHVSCIYPSSLTSPPSFPPHLPLPCQSHLPPPPPQLDPDLSILDTMRQLLGGNELLRERLGRVVDRICHASAPPSLFMP